MSSTEFLLQIADIDEAIIIQMETAAVIDQTVARLLRTAFRDPDIVAKFNNQVRMRGPDLAVAMAEGKQLSRSLWFGSLKGGLLDRVAREDALAAIAALRPAVQRAEDARLTLEDLRNAKRALLTERASRSDARRAQSVEAEREQRQNDRPRERGRSKD